MIRERERGGAATIERERETERDSVERNSKKKVDEEEGRNREGGKNSLSRSSPAHSLSSAPSLEKAPKRCAELSGRRESRVWPAEGRLSKDRKTMVTLRAVLQLSRIRLFKKKIKV